MEQATTEKHETKVLRLPDGSVKVYDFRAEDTEMTKA